MKNSRKKVFNQFVRAVFVCTAVLAVSTTVGLISDAHALVKSKPTR